MAAKKVTITTVYVKNSKVPTTTSPMDVESEIVNNQVVARQEIVNPGVVSSAQ